VELIYKQAPGAPRARIDFTSWDLSPRIADGSFTFQPGEAAKQVAFEQFVGGLLSGGNPTGPAAPNLRRLARRHADDALRLPPM